MCILLIAQLFWLVGKMGAADWFYHPSWIAVVTPTDRPASVSNRYVTDHFVDVFVFCFACLNICRGLCHRNESDLFLLFYP